MKLFPHEFHSLSSYESNEIVSKSHNLFGRDDFKENGNSNQSLASDRAAAYGGHSDGFRVS